MNLVKAQKINRTHIRWFDRCGIKTREKYKDESNYVITRYCASGFEAIGTTVHTKECLNRIKQKVKNPHTELSGTRGVHQELRAMLLPTDNISPPSGL